MALWQSFESFKTAENDAVVKRNVENSNSTKTVNYDSKKIESKNDEIQKNEVNDAESQMDEFLKGNETLEDREKEIVRESAENKLKIICSKQKLIDQKLYAITWTIQQDKTSGERQVNNNWNITKLPTDIVNLMSIKKSYEDQFINIFAKNWKIQWTRSNWTTPNDIMFQPKMFLNVWLKNMLYDESKIKLNITEREQDWTRSDYNWTHPNRKIKQAKNW